MAERSSYVSDQIDRTEAARQRYESRSTKENYDRLVEESARTKRALEREGRVGGGRGLTNPMKPRQGRTDARR